MLPGLVSNMRKQDQDKSVVVYKMKCQPVTCKIYEGPVKQEIVVHGVSKQFQRSFKPMNITQTKDIC